LSRRTDDARIAGGMQAQLDAWRARLDRGERRLGWKIGINVAEVQRTLAIDAPVIGSISSGSNLAPGARHALTGGTRIGVEPEVAVHVGSDVPGGSSEEHARRAIAALGPAIEVVDIDLPFEDLERILARNVFHRAVALGPADEGRAGGQVGDLVAHVRRNGIEEASARADTIAGDLPATVMLVADLLAELGETLTAGDVIISGSLTPIIWVEAGDLVEVDLGPLGALELGFASA
jgi:2-keto-4-pentenoate hydratase